MEEEAEKQKNQLNDLAKTEFENSKQDTSSQSIFPPMQTQTNTLSQEDPKPSYSPNKTFMFNLIDTVIDFIRKGKELERELTDKNVNLVTMGKEELDKLILNSNEALKPLLEKYKVMKEKFENIEQQILIEASEQLGFGERDYFIKPLKDLIELIKERRGNITVKEATIYLERLAKLIAINQAIEKIPIIPYVGPIINGIIEGLDSYSSTKATLTKFLDMLQDFGVPSCELDAIRSYTKDTFFTRKYELFKDWLVNGGDFDIMYPFSLFENIKKKAKDDVDTFFNNFQIKNGEIKLDNSVSDSNSEFSNLEYENSSVNKLGTLINELRNLITENKENKKFIEEVKKIVSLQPQESQEPQAPEAPQPPPPLQTGGTSDWTPIGSVKTRNNKKTRRTIYKINHTIKSYLSRLRRTRRKPFRKPVATLNVKRRF
jgi:hypothetical protein